MWEVNNKGLATYLVYFSITASRFKHDIYGIWRTYVCIYVFVCIHTQNYIEPSKISKASKLDKGVINMNSFRNVINVISGGKPSPPSDLTDGLEINNPWQFPPFLPFFFNGNEYKKKIIILRLWENITIKTIHKEQLKSCAYTWKFHRIPAASRLTSGKRVIDRATTQRKKKERKKRWSGKEERPPPIRRLPYIIAIAAIKGISPFWQSGSRGYQPSPDTCGEVMQYSHLGSAIRQQRLPAAPSRSPVVFVCIYIICVRLLIG